MTKLILSRAEWPGTPGLFFRPHNYAGPTVSPGLYLNIDQGTRLVPWQLFISIVTLTLINKLISHYYANLASGGSLRYRKYLDTDFTFIIKPTIAISSCLLPDKPTERSNLSNVLTFNFSFRWAFRVVEWLYWLMDALISLGLNLSHVEAEYLSRKSWCLVKVVVNIELVIKVPANNSPGWSKSSILPHKTHSLTGRKEGER